MTGWLIGVSHNKARGYQCWIVNPDLDVLSDGHLFTQPVAPQCRRGEPLWSAIAKIYLAEVVVMWISALSTHTRRLQMTSGWAPPTGVFGILWDRHPACPSYAGETPALQGLRKT